MDDRSQRAAAQAYTASLDQTLQELQQKVREHEDELEKVHIASRCHYSYGLLTRE